VIAAVVVAALGWFVIERFARERERRADLREMVKGFGTSVDDIVQTAAEFYGLSGSEPRALLLASAIRAKISGLQRIVAAINEAGLSLEVNDQIRLFRQSVTGGDFDSLARAPRQTGSMIDHSIRASGQDLSREVQLSLYRALAASAAGTAVLKSPSSSV
jgi:hypothetical protein